MSHLIHDHEPLRPDPLWRKYNNTGWSSKSGTVSSDHPPKAYAYGFEDGARALAATVWELLKNKKEAEAYRLLMRYDNGVASPTRGWEHEPSRS